MEKFTYKFENHSTVANVCVGIWLAGWALWGVPTALWCMLGVGIVVLGVAIVSKIDNLVRSKNENS